MKVSSWPWGNVIKMFTRSFPVFTLICMYFLAGYVWMRHNISGIRKPGWNLSWGYAKDLQREVSNLWLGGVTFEQLFCPLSGQFDAADIWIWSCKELGPLNLAVQSSGSASPSNTFFAAGKQFTTRGNCFRFVLFFLDFIQLKSLSINWVKGISFWRNCGAASVGEWYTKIWFINGVDNVNWPPYRDQYSITG